jgi:hypothetical protein
MSTCKGCGAETLRTVTTFDVGVRKEVCPQCDPNQFDSPVTDPSDKKIYVGWEAMPEKYRIENGVAHAKDELLQDSEDLINRTPEVVEIEAKRRTRRTEPLSQEEIMRAEHWGRTVLRPQLERDLINRQYGHRD